MPSPPRAPASPPTSTRALALTVVVSLAACAIAAAVMAPTMLGGVPAWLVLIVASVVLVIAIAALWAIDRRRDRPLR